MTNVEILKNDITTLEIDAIVNAANSKLVGGGGVDGAIHKAGGPIINEQCQNIIIKLGGNLPVGDAVVTQAGNMPAKYVIHTVGPIWKGGEKHEELFLTKAYRSSLQLAVDFGLKSIAFPNISTGVYGYPKELAAQVAVKEVKRFISESDFLENIIFCCWDSENFNIYNKLWSEND